MRFDTTQLDKIIKYDEVDLPPEPEAVPPTHDIGDVVFAHASGFLAYKVNEHAGRPGIILGVIEDKAYGQHSYVVLFGHTKVEVLEEEIQEPDS